MKDLDNMNEVRAESLRETFYEAIEDGNWPIARDMLTRMEDMRISTFQFRREMENAIAETDDIAYVPLEQEIPVMSEYEKRTGQMPYTSPRSSELTFGMSSEALEQAHLSELARQANA